MAVKNSNDLELTLKLLKEREVKLKEELALARKKEDARFRKELARKKCVLADVVVEILGEQILDNPETLKNYF